MRDLPESFAEEPRSITDIKANKSGNAADWTPRDALIDVLRMIDKGEIAPQTLFIGWSEVNEKGDKISTDYRNSAPTGVHTMGLLLRLSYRFNRVMDSE